MQVTPEAGRDTAKRFGVRYDWTRLVSDPVYNTNAELAALLREYRDSYITEVDWVESIPFAETRNYVQRVMENLQTYRVRIGDNAQVMSKPN